MTARPVTADRVLSAIGIITRETGYAPTPAEVAYALGCNVRQVHSALLPAKRAGRVRYGEGGTLVLSES